MTVSERVRTVAGNRFELWCEQYGLEYIRRLAEDGLTNGELAAATGLKPSDIKRWRKRYPKFRDAIDIGRREADFSVVEAVYKKAVGYNVETEKAHKLKHVEYDPETGKKLREYEELKMATDVDYVAPDLRAGIFWLKNRQPEHWSEKGSSAEMTEGGVVVIPNADRIDAAPDDTEIAEEV